MRPRSRQTEVTPKGAKYRANRQVTNKVWSYGRAEKKASLLVPMTPKAQKLGVKEAPAMGEEEAVILMWTHRWTGWGWGRRTGPEATAGEFAGVYFWHPFDPRPLIPGPLHA